MTVLGFWHPRPIGFHAVHFAVFGHFAREGVYMAWSWQYLTAEGVVVAELPDTSMATEFPSQSDAETWIGEVWQTLLDAGIEQVLLLEEDRIVYGPMGLRPE